MIFCFLQTFFSTRFCLLLKLETLNETEWRFHVFQNLSQFFYFCFLVFNLLTPHIDITSKHLSLGEYILHCYSQSSLPFLSWGLAHQIKPLIVWCLIDIILKIKFNATFKIISSKIISIVNFNSHHFFACFNIKSEHLVPHGVKFLFNEIWFLSLATKLKHTVRICFASNIHWS